MLVGSGGSGWVFTEKNVKNGYTDSAKTGGTWKLDAKYYLRDAETIAGNQSVPTEDGTSTMVGKTGNGYAKISNANGKGIDEYQPRDLDNRPYYNDMY